MNQIAPTSGNSLIVAMSERYGMTPAAFQSTLMSTVFPDIKVRGGGYRKATTEEVFAFLLVAKEHQLNPITGEIFPMPSKRGGIKPLVSVDGWATLINRQPDLDGVTFEDHIQGGEMVSITCRIHHKGRQHPVEITEYMDECRIPGKEPWDRWPRRMLRHKSLIQCARIAFGFAGIMDQDEFDRHESAVSARDIPSAPEIPSPQVEALEDLTEAQEKVMDDTPSGVMTLTIPSPKDAELVQAAEEMVERMGDENKEGPPRPVTDPDKLLSDLDMDMQSCGDRDSVEHVWASYDVNSLMPPDKEAAIEMYDRHLRRVDNA